MEIMTAPYALIKYCDSHEEKKYFHAKKAERKKRYEFNVDLMEIVLLQ